MSTWSRTSREVDGEVIPGSWRHAFIRNAGTYYLTDLIVYADGLVDCWGLVTLEEFRDKLISGWVATTFTEGARASAHELAAWTFTDVTPAVTADDLYAEVVDRVETLNGRPDSCERCLDALEVYMADRTEENRLRLRDAFGAIPDHRKMYVLHDMDSRDGPLRAVTGPGGAGATWALEYLTEFLANRRRWAATSPGPGTSVIVPGSHHLRGWPDPPGLVALHTRFPAAVRIGATTYPTVEHAYWALRTTDAAVQDEVMSTSNPYALTRIGAAAAARDGWEAALPSTILQLLRAKFRQHEALAAELDATGDGRILFHSSGFADVYQERHRQRLIGRALEVVRAEHRAGRSGLLDLAALDAPSGG